MIVEEYLGTPTTDESLQQWLQRLEESYQRTVQLTDRLSVFDTEKTVDFTSMCDSLFGEHRDWYTSSTRRTPARFPGGADDGKQASTHSHEYDTATSIAKCAGCHTTFATGYNQEAAAVPLNRVHRSCKPFDVRSPISWSTMMQVRLPSRSLMPQRNRSHDADISCRPRQCTSACCVSFESNADSRHTHRPGGVQLLHAALLRYLVDICVKKQLARAVSALEPLAANTQQDSPTMDAVLSRFFSVVQQVNQVAILLERHFHSFVVRPRNALAAPSDNHSLTHS